MRKKLVAARTNPRGLYMDMAARLRVPPHVRNYAALLLARTPVPRLLARTPVPDQLIDLGESSSSSLRLQAAYTNKQRLLHYYF